MPIAFAPVIDLETATSDVFLFEGKLKIECAAFATVGDAKVFWRWLPRPNLNFHATFATPDIAKFMWGRILNETAVATATINGRQFDFAISNLTTDELPYTADGTLFENQSRIQEVPIERLQAHVPSFISYLGNRITDKSGRASSRGRAEATVDGWHVILDRTFGSSEQRTIAEHRGYEISHVVSVSRVDSSTFSFGEVEDFLDLLANSLSFMRGRWVAPLLVYGFAPNSPPMFLRKHFGRLKGFASTVSCVDDLSTDWFQSILEGFHRRSNSPVWLDPLEHAIYWYVESNSDRSGGIEGAIILIQAALESLSWTYWTTDRGVVSASGFEKTPASDRISLLLHEARIPSEIPTECTSLIKIARERGWSTGATAICEIRNKLVHATPSNRETLKKIAIDAQIECYTLGLHYLELVILWLTGYDGKYLNRMRQKPLRVQAIERVPWA